MVRSWPFYIQCLHDYVAPVSCVKNAHGVYHHSYEDDVMLYLRMVFLHKGYALLVGLLFMYNDQ